MSSTQQVLELASKYPSYSTPCFLCWKVRALHATWLHQLRSTVTISWRIELLCGELHNFSRVAQREVLEECKWDHGLRPAADEGSEEKQPSGMLNGLPQCKHFRLGWPPSTERSCGADLFPGQTAVDSCSVFRELIWRQTNTSVVIPVLCYPAAEFGIVLIKIR